MISSSLYKLYLHLKNSVVQDIANIIYQARLDDVWEYENCDSLFTSNGYTKDYLRVTLDNLKTAVPLEFMDGLNPGC